MNELEQYVLSVCQSAKIASSNFSNLDLATKNNVLNEVKNLISYNRSELIYSNKIDLNNARQKALDSAKIDRLTIDDGKINSLILSLEEVIKLPDPVGRVIHHLKRPTGLDITRISTPIGVLLAIYEARPNVTCDISSLAFKAGNAVILRSSSDCFNSSKFIASQFKTALHKFSLDQNLVSFVENSDYDVINKLLKMNNYIDVVIPRGGKNLIKAVMQNSNIAMFNHLHGNCHTYIHSDADFEKARKILINAKLRRTSICGATETMLIDRSIAYELLGVLTDDLTKNNCLVRGDQESCKIDSRIEQATDDDYYCEYLDKIIAVKIVENVDEAIGHIAKYGSSHTESIITENHNIAEKFLAKVNSAIVMHNASTQFADGYEFGMGAEVGIATGKLHARGPIGLEQLTTFKYQVRADFAIRN